MHRFAGPHGIHLVVLLGAVLLADASSREPRSLAEEAVRPDWGLANFKAAPRWERQPPDRTSYPELLGWATHGQGGERSVMTLVARQLMPGTSVEKFAGMRSNQKAGALLAIKEVHVRTQVVEGWGHRVQLDGILSSPVPQPGPLPVPMIIRQYFFMNGTIGYVLTLVGPQSQASARLRDLDETIVNLVTQPGSGDHPR